MESGTCESMGHNHPETSLPQTPIQPQAIGQTEQWLVINKPSGWHCVRTGHGGHGSGSDEASSSDPVLQDWLEAQFPELAPLRESGLVQRLDYLTSGCVIAGRSDEAVARLRSAIRRPSGGIGKTYLAMVEGDASPGSFELFFHSRYRRSRKISVSDSGADAERGQCRWRVRTRFPHHTLLEVDLIGPGRRHQIRAGLSHLGHPLLGDELYGGPPWDGRFGLHAWRVVIDSEPAEAPQPDSWAR